MKCINRICIFKVLQGIEGHKTLSYSASSTQVVCDQQKCAWELNRKDILSGATVVMAQYLEVAILMISSSTTHQILTIAPRLSTIHISAQWEALFWQEIKAFVWMKWKFLDSTLNNVCYYVTGQILRLVFMTFTWSCYVIDNSCRLKITIKPLTGFPC